MYAKRGVSVLKNIIITPLKRDNKIVMFEFDYNNLIEFITKIDGIKIINIGTAIQIKYEDRK